MNLENQNIKYRVKSEDKLQRLDKHLTAVYHSLSRSFIQNLIKDGHILVNDKAEKASYKLGEGDLISIHIPKAREIPVLPENIPIDILYEDADLLIVNKGKGMVVHPSPGHDQGTLVNAVLYHCKNSLSGINGNIRPGIVHRIDMDTTGAIIICKNDKSHIHIAKQIKEHTVTRRYQAIVNGLVKNDSGIIEGSIGRHPKDRKKMAINEKNGKPAITHYRVIKRFQKHTHMEFELKTGRTHQIRVHMASIAHPILGDALYGRGKDPKNLQGQTLHAIVIGFIHPTTRQYMEFTAPLPDYFTDLLNNIII